MDHTDYPFFTMDHGTDHTDHGVGSDRDDGFVPPGMR